jgi:arylsulfatase A-like enzyme
MAADTRPNVLLVTTHDLGRHLGCYGWDVDTPRIDAIAAEGVRFDRPFCVAPQCCPSRSAMLTGLYPHENGMMGLVHRGWELDEGVRALPGLLRDAGYATYLADFQHVAADPERLGFETRIGKKDPDRGALDTAAAFEAAVGELADEQPFYAQVGFDEVHHPWRRDYVDDAAYAAKDPDAVELPYHLEDADDDTRRQYADFLTLVESVLDPAVGRIVNALDDAGLAENTLVLFLADHGISFGQHARRGAKLHPTNAGLGITTIARHPALDDGPCDDLVSNVDITPTVLDFCGVDAPVDFSGRSVRGAVDGRVDDYTPRERVFAEQTWHGGSLYPFRAVRTEDRKYVVNVVPRSFCPGDGPDVPKEECYDLERDPNELDNVAPTRKRGMGPPVNETQWRDGTDEPVPEYAEDVSRLRTTLHDWLDRTDDPVLDGCLPLPPAEVDWWGEQV